MLGGCGLGLCDRIRLRDNTNNFIIFQLSFDLISKDCDTQEDPLNYFFNYVFFPLQIVSQQLGRENLIPNL